MSPRVQALYGQAAELSQAERYELAALLLDDDEEQEPGYEEAWAAEIKRRIEEIDQGTAKSIPWHQVRQMLRDNINHAD